MMIATLVVLVGVVAAVLVPIVVAIMVMITVVGVARPVVVARSVLRNDAPRHADEEAQ